MGAYAALGFVVKASTAAAPEVTVNLSLSVTNVLVPSVVTPTRLYWTLDDLFTEQLGKPAEIGQLVAEREQAEPLLRLVRDPVRALGERR